MALQEGPPLTPAAAQDDAAWGAGTARLDARPFKMSPTPDAAGTKTAWRLQDEARGLGMSLRTTRALHGHEATAGDQDGTG